MKYHFLAGVDAEDIDVVADIISKRLGSYEKHDSLYLGIYNLFRCPEKFEVKPDYVEGMDDWDEPSFKNLKILLRAQATERPSFFQKNLEELNLAITVIRCEEWS